MTITIAGVGILHALLFWFLPRLTRQDLFFAVTVAPGFRDDPQGESIVHHYRTELVLFSALALAAFIAGASRLGVAFAPGGYLTQVLASFIAFYRARQHVLPHALPPTTVREADLGGGNRIVPGGGIAASSGPFILLVAGAAYLWIHGQEIPARFTMHWAAAGSGPHGWASRTLASVYFLSTAGILAALTLVRYGISHWVRSVHAGGPEFARELKFRARASAILLGMQYFIALRSSWLVLVPRRHGLEASPPGIIVIVLLPLALVPVAMAVLARLGQGGSRVVATSETPPSTSALPVGDRTQDHYWKLGFFYFNPDDEATLIEARFGLGYTLNFARPATWIIVLLMLMGPLVPLLVSRLHR